MAENSQIQAKGVGKDAKRHDLDGTPGLDSDLQSGEVGQLEEGQRQVQNTVSQQTVTQPGVPPSQADATMAIPDPVQFAGDKIGGSLEGAGQAPMEEKINFSNWLPFLRRLASSPTSSGLLQRAFVKRMTTEMKRPTGTNTALIRQRDFDNRLEQLNGGR